MKLFDVVDKPAGHRPNTNDPVIWLAACLRLDRKRLNGHLPVTKTQNELRRVITALHRRSDNVGVQPNQPLLNRANHLTSARRLRSDPTEIDPDEEVIAGDLVEKVEQLRLTRTVAAAFHDP